MSTSTYDELPYLGFPRRHAHPSVIAANARIFGVEAPAVQAVSDGSLTIAQGLAFPEDENERDAMISDQIRISLKQMADMGLFLKSE